MNKRMQTFILLLGATLAGGDAPYCTPVHFAYVALLSVINTNLYSDERSIPLAKLEGMIGRKLLENEIELDDVRPHTCHNTTSWGLLYR